MRSLKMTVFAVAFLALTIYLFPNQFLKTTSFAQSAPTNLEGAYDARTVPLPPLVSAPSSFRLLHTMYIFEKQGKVICRHTITAIGHDKTEFKYNPDTRRYENVRSSVPGEYVSVDEIGTYKQTGMKVRMEFSDRLIEASIIERPSHGLIGTTTLKESNKTEEFIVSDVRNRWRLPKTEEGPGDPVETPPGLVRTEDGKLQPAKGYGWVNPNDPKDLRVERIP